MKKDRPSDFVNFQDVSSGGFIFYAILTLPILVIIAKIFNIEIELSKGNFVITRLGAIILDIDASGITFIVALGVCFIVAGLVIMPLFACISYLFRIRKIKKLIEKGNDITRKSAGKILFFYVCQQYMELHSWNGCKCNNCEKTRDGNDIQHRWNGCKCTDCGKTRDWEHDVGNDCFCKRCGQKTHAWETIHSEYSDYMNDGGEHFITREYSICKCKVCGETRKI